MGRVLKELLRALEAQGIAGSKARQSAGISILESRWRQRVKRVGMTSTGPTLEEGRSRQGEGYQGIAIAFVILVAAPGSDDYQLFLQVL